MSQTANLKTPAPRDDAAATPSTGSYPTIVPLRQPAARNRAAGMEAVAGNAAEPSQTRGVTGMADVFPADVSSEWPSSQELYMAARRNRAFTLGEIAAAIADAVGDFARRLFADYQRRRRAAEARAALHALDDRTLHDLGIDRSEIGSIAAEAVGAAATSRTQVLRAASRAGSH